MIITEKGRTGEQGHGNREAHRLDTLADSKREAHSAGDMVLVGLIYSWDKARLQAGQSDIQSRGRLS